VARATTEELTFEASVPITVNGSTDQGCRLFAIELGGTLHGKTPFEQNPASITP
jgi:hypothetical protein